MISQQLLDLCYLYTIIAIHNSYVCYCLQHVDGGHKLIEPESVSINYIVFEQYYHII